MINFVGPVRCERTERIDGELEQRKCDPERQAFFVRYCARDSVICGDKHAFLLLGTFIIQQTLQFEVGDEIADVGYGFAEIRTVEIDYSSFTSVDYYLPRVQVAMYKTEMI